MWHTLVEKHKHLQAFPYTSLDVVVPNVVLAERAGSLFCLYYTAFSVFYCENQANPKMIKFSSGLVPLLTDKTIYATYSSSWNERDVEQQDSIVANSATVP